MIKNITTNELKQMTGEGLVLQGCGGDPNEWLGGINEVLTEAGVLLDGDTFKNIYVFEREDITNILFDMEGIKLNIGKLAIWRLQTRDSFAGTWLSDYLPNRLGVELGEYKPEVGEIDVESESDTPPIAVSGEWQNTYSDGPQKDDGEKSTETRPIRVHIENLYDDSIGGFTMPFPTTKEALRPFLENAELTSRQGMKICEVISDVGNLGETITDAIYKTMPPDALDELNYLASKIHALQPNDFEVFAAATDAKRHCGSVSELINLTENLDRFDIQPGYSVEQYGDFLIEMEKENTRAVFERLEKSDNPDERYFAQYVLRLEAHVDEETFGRAAVEEENGVFTDHGYLTEREGFKEVYRGPQDIPAEHLLFSNTGEVVRPLVKVENMHVTPAIVKLCAVSSGHMPETADILKSIAAETTKDYLLIAGADGIHFSPAIDAYKRSGGNSTTIDHLSQQPDNRYFALHVSMSNRGEGGNREVIGNMVELDRKGFEANIARHCISPDRVDATMADGSERSYDLWDWANMPIPYRSQIVADEPHYSEADIQKAHQRYEHFRSVCDKGCKLVSESELLTGLNSAYMDAAEHPHPDMIRVTNDAAKEILARGDADVYHLTTAGAEKLAPIEAARPMCFAEHSDLAIRREDAAGLNKWAKRTADSIIRKNERGEHDKVKNKSEEL